MPNVPAEQIERYRGKPDARPPQAISVAARTPAASTREATDEGSAP